MESDSIMIYYSMEAVDGTEETFVICPAFAKPTRRNETLSLWYGRAIYSDLVFFSIIFVLLRPASRQFGLSFSGRVLSPLAVLFLSWSWQFCYWNYPYTFALRSGLSVALRTRGVTDARGGIPTTSSASMKSHTQSNISYCNIFAAFSTSATVHQPSELCLFKLSMTIPDLQH